MHDDWTANPNRDVFTLTPNIRPQIFKYYYSDPRYWTPNIDTNPDGTAFTDFLARLNGEVASSLASEQLGGHSDWRLPTSAELQTILDCSLGRPPCIVDPIFDPTAAAAHWSSTSIASLPNSAWNVDFGNGIVMGFNKGIDFRVRAVRRGR